MYSVRKDATESALKYLFTNANDNAFEGVAMLKRKSTFEIVNESDDNEGGPKRKQIESTIINKG